MAGGPTTRNTTSIALGLAQVRIGASATYIGNINPQLAAGDSIGSLTTTRFTGNVDWYKHESGFPLLEDLTIALREAAALECSFEEVNPLNMNLAYGIDISLASYAAHSGEVKLGARTSPAYIRMEAIYTYPDGTNQMSIIFPRAQCAAAIEVDLAKEDAAAVPITIESKIADSNVSGGDAVWDTMPLGRIAFTDA